MKRTLNDRSRGRRNKYVSVAFTAEEKNVLDDLVSKTTCRSVSEYVRKVCLGRPIVQYYRNQSLDDLVNQLIPLRKEIAMKSDPDTIGKIYPLINTIANVCKDHLFEKYPGDPPVS